MVNKATELRYFNNDVVRGGPCVSIIQQIEIIKVATTDKIMEDIKDNTQRQSTKSCWIPN